MTYWSNHKDDILYEYGNWNQRLKEISSLHELLQLEEEMKKMDVWFVTKKKGKGVYSFSEQLGKIHYFLDDGYSEGCCSLEFLHRQLCIHGYLQGKRKKDGILLTSNFFPILFQNELFTFSNDMSKTEGHFIVTTSEKLLPLGIHKQIYQWNTDEFPYTIFRNLKSAILETFVLMENGTNECSVHFFPSEEKECFFRPLLMKLKKADGHILGYRSDEELLFDYHLSSDKLIKHLEYKTPKSLPISKWLNPEKMMKSDYLYIRTRTLLQKYPFETEVFYKTEFDKQLELFDFAEECFSLLNEVAPLKSILHERKPIKVHFKLLSVTGQYLTHRQNIEMGVFLGFTDHQTFAHEFGHHLSHCIISQWDSYELPLEDVKKEAAIIRNEIIDWILEHSKMLKEKLAMNPKDKKWLTNREEIFARSFASYVCYKAGNPFLFQENKKIWIITLPDGKQRRILPEYYLEEIQAVAPLFERLIDCFTRKEVLKMNIS